MSIPRDIPIILEGQDVSRPARVLVMTSNWCHGFDTLQFNDAFNLSTRSILGAGSFQLLAEVVKPQEYFLITLDHVFPNVESWLTSSIRVYVKILKDLRPCRFCKWYQMSTLFVHMCLMYLTWCWPLLSRKISGSKKPDHSILVCGLLHAYNISVLLGQCLDILF